MVNPDNIMCVVSADRTCKIYIGSHNYWVVRLACNHKTCFNHSNLNAYLLLARTTHVPLNFMVKIYKNNPRMLVIILIQPLTVTFRDANDLDFVRF